MRIRSRRSVALRSFPIRSPLIFFTSISSQPLSLSERSLNASPTKKNRLQDYVRARLVQFAGAFAARACPQLGAADVRAAAAAAIARLPAPLLGDGRNAAAGGASGAGDGPRELQLVFRHDCL